ncbi:MAG: hypothetical protein JSS87_02645 [Acidobacteria bacterium]|nr:hypothetical protein [Acidobacteriota bacterium]
MFFEMHENQNYSPCLNETAQFEYITQEGLRHARQYAEPLSLLRICVSEKTTDFAKVILRFALRETDVAAIIDSSNFVVLLPATDFYEATVVAEKLRSFLEMSIGVASLNDEPHSLMQRAEQALLKAMVRGGNRVCF